ncbi:hypothetical protein [Streptomyces sp. NPDC059874]|uniref:hypothetical protein n=1 Tax=Streptomyces sp. NPDC059874 TaxID=3346983 RepID=UPI0036566C64
MYAVAARYRGRIEAYELWPVANDHRCYVGSASTLVEMTRRASRLIKAAADLALHRAGAQPRLWNTDTTYAIPLDGRLPPAKARDYAVRFFLVGL